MKEPLIRYVYIFILLLTTSDLMAQEPDNRKGKAIYPFELSSTFGVYHTNKYNNGVTNEYYPINLGVNLGAQGFISEKSALGVILFGEVLANDGDGVLGARIRYSLFNDDKQYDIGIGPIFESRSDPIKGYSFEFSYRLNSAFKITLRNMSYTDKTFRFVPGGLSGEVSSNQNFTGLGIEVTGKLAKFLRTIGLIFIGAAIVSFL